jgi:hypothetical protein
MDIFDVKRRDFPKLDRFAGRNAKPFGGPGEKEDFQGNKRKSLNKYQRVIERDWKTEGSLHNPVTGEEMFQPNYDSAWHAVTSDKVSRDAKKKPTDVMTAKATIFTQPVEENKIMRFEQFVNENFENPEIGNEEESMQPEYMQTEEVDDQVNLEDEIDSGYEVDEEQLEQLMEEYGDDLNELLDKIVTEMEIEKEEAGELLAAAFEKICKEEETEETGEETGDESTEEGA